MVAAEEADIAGEVVEEAEAAVDDGPSPLIDTGVDALGSEGFVEADVILQHAEEEAAAEEAARVAAEAEALRIQEETAARVEAAAEAVALQEEQDAAREAEAAEREAAVKAEREAEEAEV